MQVAALEQFN